MLQYHNSKNDDSRLGTISEDENILLFDSMIEENKQEGKGYDVFIDEISEFNKELSEDIAFKEHQYYENDFLVKRIDYSFDVFNVKFYYNQDNQLVKIEASDIFDVNDDAFHGHSFIRMTVIAKILMTSIDLSKEDLAYLFAEIYEISSEGRFSKFNFTSKGYTIEFETKPLKDNRALTYLFFELRKGKK